MTAPETKVVLPQILEFDYTFDNIQTEHFLESYLEVDDIVDTVISSGIRFTNPMTEGHLHSWASSFDKFSPPTPFYKLGILMSSLYMSYTPCGRSFPSGGSTYPLSSSTTCFVVGPIECMPSTWVTPHFALLSGMGKHDLPFTSHNLRSQCHFLEDSLEGEKEGEH